MKTLREKIEGLERFRSCAGMLGQAFMENRNHGEYLERAQVLRIIAEHEQAQAPVLDITPGGPVKTAPPVGQAGGDETHAEYVARLRKDVDDCRRALEEAKRRTSLYDHEQEMLEYAEEELAEALESAAEVEQMARDADGGSK